MNHQQGRAEATLASEDVLELAAGGLPEDRASLLRGLALDVKEIWVDDPDDHVTEVLGQLGFSAVRDLFKLGRSLPVDEAFELETRSFVPGSDDSAWLRVNNAAFAWHREQGGWTQDDLDERMSEPWFDPEGFLLHEIDGALAGFCWTKIHGNETPVVGEIYVIAADPAFHGIGLGRRLTLAGLHHIASREVDTAILYVDADNTAAVRLYDSLGFEPLVTRRLFLHTEQAEQASLE